MQPDLNARAEERRALNCADIPCVEGPQGRRNVTFRQLQYFLVLAKVGSYGRAAKACGVTQSTLSLMIQRLEQELGIILFDRRSNPATLTPLGRRLRSHARVIVRNVDKMRALSQLSREENNKNSSGTVVD